MKELIEIGIRLRRKGTGNTYITGLIFINKNADVWTGFRKMERRRNGAVVHMSPTGRDGLRIISSAAENSSGT